MVKAAQTWRGRTPRRGRVSVFEFALFQTPRLQTPSAEMTQAQIRNRIRAARLYLEMTQAEAAEKAGVDQPYWSAVETGYREVRSISVLGRLAAAVGLKLVLNLEHTK